MERREKAGEEAAAIAYVKPARQLQQKAIVSSGKGGNFASAAIRRAEEALETLSVDFDAWIAKEIATLETAHKSARAAQYDGKDLDRLFRAAHDLKGQAATLGYPLVGEVCASLSRLIEAAPVHGTRFSALVNAHVAAAAAMVREHACGESNETARTLAESMQIAASKYVAATTDRKSA